MQALSMYILTRLDEGETEHNNCDVLLATTLATVAQQLMMTDWLEPLIRPELTQSPLRRDWLDWLFIESRRRLSILFRSIDLLVYFDPAAICPINSGLIFAPLPCHTAFWSARSEAEWSRARASLPGDMLSSANGMTVNGDLIQVDTSMPPRPLPDGDGVWMGLENKQARWEEWCAGMDEYGGLIMLGAALVGS
jgi:hypothetical protein